MKSRANEGLKKVTWITIITLVILVVLAAIFWWYDDYLIKELHKTVGLVNQTFQRNHLTGLGMNL